MASDRPDYARLRISDAEREAVAEALREAHLEGRLSLTELEERLEAVYRARTLGELPPLTADLPRALTPHGHPLPLPAPPAPTPDLVLTFTRGRTYAPYLLTSGFTVQAVASSVEVDLSRAHVQRHRTVLVVNAVFSRVRLRVPDGVEVVMAGRSVGGGRRARGGRRRGGRTPEAPVLVIEGTSLFGVVTVVRSRLGAKSRPLPGRLGLP